MTTLDRPLWGDFHNHNGVGYGQGSMDRSYAIARGALLDAYCFTPHGLWHDQPATDPAMVEFHRTGFGKVLDAWPAVRDKANRENQPGRFTALVGFEWHSSANGDYHLLFPGEEGEVCAARSLEELQEFAAARGALMILHHFGYPGGWRGGRWAGLRPELTPAVEGFSEHGCSLEADSNFPMLGHSMGGQDRAQSLLAQLAAGRLAGVIGSTDNHWGHPASYGEGLAALWAAENTRSGVLDALRRRHVYAASGDRIGLAMRMADGIMGDVLRASSPRELECRVSALGPVECVRIIKNGRTAHIVPGPDPAPAAEARGFVARLEFGWDGMTSREVTDWTFDVRVEGGRLLAVHPCFCGGAGSVEKLNRVTAVSDGGFSAEAFTSRLNTRPTSQIGFEVEGGPDAVVTAEVQGRYKGRAGERRLRATGAELLAGDRWEKVAETFSAPKVRLGSAHSFAETRFDVRWRDPEPGGADWYMVKVLQRNGQAAWSSPIWFAAE